MSKALILLLLLFLAAQAGFLLSEKSPYWDEAVYSSMGKYLFSAGSTGLWEPARPTALPMLLGAMWTAGVPGLWTAAMLAIAIGCLALTYLIAKEYSGSTQALLAASTLVVTPIFFKNSSLLLTDVPGAAAALLSIYLLMRQKYAWSGAAAAIAFQTKYPHILLIPGLCVAMALYRKQGKIPSFLAGFALAILPFLALNTLMSGSPLYPYIQYSAYQQNPAYSVDGLASNLLYYPSFLLQNPILLLSIPGAAIALKRKQAIPVLACLAAYAAYFTIISNKQERLILAFLPLLAILVAVYFSQLSGYISKLKNARAYATIMALAAMAAALTPAIIADYREALAPQPGFQYATNLTGTILTTEPRFSWQSSAKFLTFYENPDVSIMDYKAKVAEADYVIYKPDYYPCERIGEECERKKEELHNLIKKENRLFSQHSEPEYYVYEVT
ncbi:glycosyltransferase family 39 protein [Candidatus Woesearchaeota archaeon]|nr:glycosyltransferase family 39 protein [Candidatus Woesearchaeota archaeon]